MEKTEIKPNASLIVSMISMGLITAGIIYFKPEPLIFLPLLVSIIVMFQQANVSRFAFLTGGLNSLLYAAAYWSMTLYTSAVYAILVSFTLQIVTFFNWSRHTDSNKTEIRKLSNKVKVLLAIIMIFSWLTLYMIFSALGSRYILLDNTVTILGMTGTILTLLRFKEYIYFTMLTQGVNLVMYIFMLGDNPQQVIYCISAVNSILCNFIALTKINHDSKIAADKKLIF